MKSKFAKAIAANIRTLAECQTRLILIDARIGVSSDPCCARAEISRLADKAESNIAAILMQPGAQPNATD